MDGTWQLKKRMLCKPPPPSPRRPTHLAKRAGKRSIEEIAKDFDDDDWLLGAGPPVAVGAPEMMPLRALTSSPGGTSKAEYSIPPRTFTAVTLGG